MYEFAKSRLAEHQKSNSARRSKPLLVATKPFLINRGERWRLFQLLILLALRCIVFQIMCEKCTTMTTEEGQKERKRKKEKKERTQAIAIRTVIAIAACN